MSADGLADRERRQHLMDAGIEYVVPASFSSASQFRGYSPIRAQPFQTAEFCISARVASTGDAHAWHGSA